MRFSRRKFLHNSSTALMAATLVPSAASARDLGRALAEAGLSVRGTPRWKDDATVKGLVTIATEAAKSAGATYADARHLVTITEGVSWVGSPIGSPGYQFSSGLGVRALVNGYWGYAALVEEEITTDAAATLGREATAQARTAAKGPPRTVELAPAPVVSGSWTTPVEIDPFTISWDEKRDFINGSIGNYFGKQPFDAGAGIQGIDFEKQIKAFASSEGSYCSQTLYRTMVSQFGVSVSPHWRTQKGGARSGDTIVSVAGAGWEYMLKASHELESERLIRQARDARFAVPVDVGRYDVVFDGAAMARIAQVQLGTATELDRAMGYLANDEGTSFINDPLNMVGELKIGTSELTVTANRSMPKGAATVKWDDEGVEPDEAVLIKNGILTDFQTTRESAGWLASYYRKAGIPLRSHGGAICHYVNGVPTQGAHNLVVAPGSTNASFEALCSGVKKGLAVMSGYHKTDWQALNTEGSGNIVYEIINGKLGRVIEGAVFLTRTPDFWKNLIGLGGAQTVQSLGTVRERNTSGWQLARCTVSAPAALAKQVVVTTNIPRGV